MCFTHLCYERIYVYYYECIAVVYMHICTHILYLISDQYSKKHVYTHAVRAHAIKPFWYRVLYLFNWEYFIDKLLFWEK